MMMQPETWGGKKLFALTDVGYCPVKLGMMSNRLQSGVNTLQGFREDKRNRITPGTALPLCFSILLISESQRKDNKLSVPYFPQCPTWTMGHSPPTRQPTTPALPTSAKKILTLSTLSMETSPACRAQTGMNSVSVEGPELCGFYAARHSSLITFQMFLFFHWIFCIRRR